MLLFRLIEVTYTAPSGASLLLFTDLPGAFVIPREIQTLPACTDRRVELLRLTGNTKGKLYKVKIVSTGAVSLFRIRAYVRALGRTSSDWQWIDIPVPGTSDQFQEFRLPIAPTSDAYVEMRLPIAPTSDAYVEARLPIRPTSDQEIEIPLPIDPSPQTETWVSLAEDA